MAISFMAILVIAFFLFMGIGLVATVVLLSGKYGGKIAVGIGTLVLAGILLFCGGIPFMYLLGVQRAESTREQAIRVEAASHANAAHERAIAIQSGSMVTEVRMDPPRPVATPAKPPVPPVAEITSDDPSFETLSIQERVNNPGREVGMWIGSIYQGFRNRVKSIDLSVDPSKIIPPGRPSWVEQAPSWNDHGTYCVSVSSGPYDRGIECQKSLDQEVDKAIGQFANEILENDHASELLKDDLAKMRQSVVSETYHEQLTPSFGIMYQWHSLLKFDEVIQNKIRELWAMQQRMSRVVYIGVGFLMVLGLLAISYTALTFSGERSRVSPWLLSAGVVISLAGLFVAGMIFFRSFPML
ncbi:hypothetical protein GC197_11220 [bacterium]|nr:hypothetical protein [bacterium]